MTNPNPQPAAPQPPKLADVLRYRLDQAKARFGGNRSSNGTPGVPMTWSALRIVLILALVVLMNYVATWGLLVDVAFWAALGIGALVLITVLVFKKRKASGTATSRMPSWARTAVIIVCAILVYQFIQLIWGAATNYLLNGVTIGVLASSILAWVLLATIAVCARVPAKAAAASAQPTQPTLPNTGP